MSSEGASRNPKDLRSEINVIQDLLPMVTEESGNTSTTASGDAVDSPMAPVQQVVQNVQRGLDEHVKPHLNKAKAALDENVGKHVQPHLEKASTAFRDIGTNTRQSIQGISSSTRSMVDDHVKPSMANIQQTAAHGLQETQKAIQPHVEKVQEVHATYAGSYTGSAPDLFAANSNDENSSAPLLFLEGTLRAFGKVVFCDNPVSGGFIFFAMLLGSPIVAICAVTSVISILYSARFLQLLEPERLRRGDVGANAVLTGAACAALFQWDYSIQGWLGSIFLAAVVLPPFTLLTYLHCTRHWMPQTPPLLVPYNVVMIVILVTILFWNGAMVQSVPAGDAVSYSITQATLNGLSAIFLVRGTFSGLLIIFGATLCSRILAAAMLLGSLFASILSLNVGVVPAEAFNAGVSGYNSVLTTAALAYYFQPSWTLVAVGFFVVILTGLFEAATAAFYWDVLGLPIRLTIGFCVAVIAVFALDKEESCSRMGALKRVPEEKLSTPEKFLTEQADEGGEPTSLPADTINEETALLAKVANV